MKLQVGSEATRAIILKYRTRLKGLLAEHEIRTTDQEHLILLCKLCELIEAENTRHKNDE